MLTQIPKDNHKCDKPFVVKKNICYYPSSLDVKYRKEDVKVVFSGESAKMKKQTQVGGMEYYVVFIKDIKAK